MRIVIVLLVVMVGIGVGMVGGVGGMWSINSPTVTEAWDWDRLCVVQANWMATDQDGVVHNHAFTLIGPHDQLRPPRVTIDYGAEGAEIVTADGRRTKVTPPNATGWWGQDGRWHFSSEKIASLAGIEARYPGTPDLPAPPLLDSIREIAPAQGALVDRIAKELP